ncbi:M1 family aminopeptidase [Nannocystis sp. ILAH1]|uniref:ABC transporter permease/M1 family aminopeptidase n=1 Tax=Nannocystis sp. ILAH1 TaxID=2996789 RepID=UPI00226D7217|nr:M1 family aminopeptidase [Nannocystis sp. ILAH1]
MTQLLSFARHELAYHLQRPVTYLYMLALLLLSFLYTATGFASMVLGGALNLDAPWLLNRSVAHVTLIGSVLVSAIAGTAVLRDFEFKTHELLFTTRLRKSSFVFGRFLGAYAVTLLVFACSVIGLWLGAHMPWLDPDKLGPYVPGAYLVPLVFYVVPNTFVLSALFFAVGVLTRSYMAVYVQGVVFFLGYSIATESLSKLDNELFAGLLDPFGVATTDLAERYWTIVEKNTLVTALEGLLLYNRLLWIGIALLVLFVAHALFRMDAARGIRGRKPRRWLELEGAARPPTPLPVVTPRRGLAVDLTRLLAQVRFYYLGLVRDRTFLAFVAVGLLFTVHGSSYSDVLWGTPTWPVTSAMTDVIRNNARLFFIILVPLYAGELMWRERALRCDQLLDVTPTSPVAVLVARLVCLALVYATLIAAMIAGGVLVQTMKGYYHYELGVYLGVLYGFYWPELVLLTMIGVFFQVVADHKYLGVLLAFVYWVLVQAFGAWGLDHNLLRFAFSPQIEYSAMNGYGPHVAASAWFNLYHFATAVLLLVLARPWLMHGTPTGLRDRLRLARARVNRRWIAALALALFAWLGVGGYVWWNTNVRNVYRSSEDEDALAAEYERNYGQYQHLPQPHVEAVDVRVDFFPERGHATAVGRFKLVNRDPAPIETLHVLLPRDIEIRAIEFDRPATLTETDERIHYRIYRLAEPLAPGGEMGLRFDIADLREGFGNLGRTTALVANGSFFTQSAMLPSLGYQRSRELDDDDRRKEQGLPERSRLPSIDDARARDRFPGEPASDWIEYTGTVCTAGDQLAVTAGELQREWTEGDRRCFTYAPVGKIRASVPFLSARYEVLRDAHDGVAIEVYYQKDHEFNVAAMVESAKRSLDYCKQNFGPYPHRHFRILEFPRYERFALATPGTIPYSENIGFIARVRPDDPDDLDYPYFVTAHEVAHQWWAYQVAGGGVQGFTMLSESLAEYTALMVMEKRYGPQAMKRFLAHELRDYLTGRAAERKAEMPLALNEAQMYIHYQKGSLVFYALREYIGEERVNAALAAFLDEFAYKPSPFPTSRDLVARLRAVTPPEYAYLIEDMFETITLYDNKVLEVTSEPLADGKHRVRFKVAARKLKADGLGVETEAPLADYIDVGVFAAPGPGDHEVGAPLWQERRKFTTGEMELDVVVDGPPHRVGIDARNLLIDRNPKDNTAVL